MNKISWVGAVVFSLICVFGHAQKSEWSKELNEAPVFIRDYYVQQYKDVNPEESLVHWQSTGLGGGRSASPVFDPKYYLERNPDVAKKIGSTNYLGAALHWLEYGIQDGRPSHPEFDIKYYVKNNRDLYQQFGLDFRKLIMHYLETGYAEGRSASP